MAFPKWKWWINFTFLTHKLTFICKHMFDEIKLPEEYEEDNEFAWHLKKKRLTS